MARVVGTATLDTVAEIGIPLAFEPSVIRTITGGQVNVYQTSSCQQAQGIATESYQFCTGIVKNNNGNYTRTYPTSQTTPACLVILSGTGAPVVKAEYLGYDDIEQEAVFDVVAADSNYQVLFEFEE